MIRRVFRFVAVAFSALGFALSAAHAGIVDFSVTFLGGSSWRYDYTINNTTPSAGFDELTIFFDSTKYANLTNGIAPFGWDPLLIQPDTGIPADGYFDVISPTGILADGVTVSGFSVTIDYLVSGAPGAQPFDLIESRSFAVLSSGRSVDPNASTVPEPGSLALVFLGVGCAYLARRRVSRGSVH